MAVLLDTLYVNTPHLVLIHITIVFFFASTVYPEISHCRNVPNGIIVLKVAGYDNYLRVFPVMLLKSVFVLLSVTNNVPKAINLYVDLVDSY